MNNKMSEENKLLQNNPLKYVDSSNAANGYVHLFMCFNILLICGIM